MNVGELRAFVIRETGWTLEYLDSIPFPKLVSLSDELAYQKQLDDYEARCGIAALIATMVNLWSKEKVNLPDLVGRPPQPPKAKRKENLIWEIAQKAGILIPQDRS